MPASVNVAIVPADPKSTSSGWAVMTRMRSISASGMGSMGTSAILGGCPLGSVDSTSMSAQTEELLADLNPQQRAAVVHEGGPLLIVAGAGSGKTRVLTRRIAYLLAQRHVAPTEILAITFTNKAAGEMKERVAAMVGNRAKVMWVMTFHSACVRILRENAKRLGFTTTFSIYDSADSHRLMTLVCRELDLDPKRYPPRAFNAQVSNLKNELIDPEDYERKASNSHEKTLAEAYTAYQRRLREANAFDFDDLIMVTVNLFQAFPDVAEHYRRRFRHVLVDEYQDTNHAQYTLVRELVGGTADKLAHQGVLRMVGILVLVDQHMPEAPPVVLGNVGERLEQVDGDHDEVVEVEGVRFAQAPLIRGVRLGSRSSSRHTNAISRCESGES